MCILVCVPRTVSFSALIVLVKHLVHKTYSSGSELFWPLQPFPSYVRMWFPFPRLFHSKDSFQIIWIEWYAVINLSNTFNSMCICCFVQVPTVTSLKACIMIVFITVLEMLSSSLQILVLLSAVAWLVFRYGDMEVGWLWGLCKWVKGVCIEYKLLSLTYKVLTTNQPPYLHI